ncbi:hemoglobin subunit alpha-D-like isoform X2 [Protopterus annectens]|uniref:hemoglobin subunit alpha-D-like isoform X2 n=1 Tax=Protopterus annectens TaxID=7888 RepID=UPI001CFA3B4A|nr:hemoglobin subunit alpha-D-like isoform X2 [Protopterus annectens]
MPLSKAEKTILLAVWERISPYIEEFGAQALTRMFRCFPETKIYFHEKNIDPGSSYVRNQGGKIVTAIGTAVQNADNIQEALADLCCLHAYRIRVDPVNFQILDLSVRLGQHGGNNCQKFIPCKLYLGGELTFKVSSQENQ